VSQVREGEGRRQRSPRLPPGFGGGCDHRGDRGSLGSLAHAAALTRAQRDQMTAEQIIATMKRDNERFRTGKEKPHNHLAQQKASAKGQYPVAVILSCIDSRAPAETIMDLGIGDVFNARRSVNQATIGSWSSG
jgi:hypothetical protein